MLRSVEFCVAYKSPRTVEWAKQVNYATKGWIRISGFESFEVARRIFHQASGDHPNDAVAILPYDGRNPWFEAEPRLIHNKHILEQCEQEA